MDRVEHQPAYWSQEAATLMAALGSGPAGLSSARAAASLRKHGANAVEDAAPLSALRLLLRQFESPLVLILVFAAIISLVLREWVDATIVLAVVLGSSMLGFFQEYRASQALSSRPSALLLWSTIIVSVLAIASPYLGKLSAVFGFTPLPASLLAAIGAIVLGYIAATEAAKAWFFRRAA